MKGLRLQTNKKEEVRVISLVDPLISPSPPTHLPQSFLISRALGQGAKPQVTVNILSELMPSVNI